MKIMLREFLTYQDFFALEMECRSFSQPSLNQIAFLKFVDQIRPELYSSPEFKADNIKRLLLRDLGETEKNGPLAKELNQIAFGLAKDGVTLLSAMVVNDFRDNITNKLTNKLLRSC